MAAVGESLLGTCQGAFENELADGAMGRRGSCLQPAFGVRRQSQVELLGAGGLHVRSPLRISIADLPDIVMTIPTGGA